MKRPLLRAALAAEKRALVAFLRTLSDHELASDPKFGDPFRSR